MCVRQITCRDLGILSITFPQDKDRPLDTPGKKRVHMIVQMDTVGREKPVAICSTWRSTPPLSTATPATDGTGSRGGAEATRALHHTRDERVGNRISE